MSEQDIFEKLALYKNLIGRLYALYAERFPEYQYFWKGLSREEQNHAGWIGQLRILRDQEKTSLDVSRFPSQAWEVCVRIVRKQIEKAKNNAVTALDALSVAMDIEKSLIEKGFFNAFDNGAIESQKLLDRLNTATIEHRCAMHRLLSANTNK